MGEYSEAFVAFDVAKIKHAVAVAVAEGGRTGEVRFLGEIENRAGPIERTVKKLAGGMIGCISALKRVRPGMGCTVSSRLWATTVWWSPRL